MNCKNCGAPRNDDCEYCGTRYVVVQQRYSPEIPPNVFEKQRYLARAMTNAPDAQRARMYCDLMGLSAKAFGL